jgi:hypothetical protein
MLLLLSFLGCLEKAPTDASLFRRTVTLRIRNQSFFVSKYARTFSSAVWVIDAPLGINRPISALANGLAILFEPNDYPAIIGCTNHSALKIRQYTLLSNRDTWGVEEDQYGRPISAAEIEELINSP